MGKLYLDDIRSPPDSSWAVVRSYDEFIAWIQTHGTPDEISFDHDLGDGVPTGMDCAKWLVETERPLLRFAVHSANPPGRENILGLLRNWRRHGRDAGVTTRIGYQFVGIAPRGAGPRGRAVEAPVIDVFVGDAAAVDRVLVTPRLKVPRVAIVFGHGEVAHASTCVRVADERAARTAVRVLTWLCAVRPSLEHLDVVDLANMLSAGREGVVLQRQGTMMLDAARAVSLAMGGRRPVAACLVLSMNMSKDDIRQANDALGILFDDDCDTHLIMRSLRSAGACPRLGVFATFQ